MSKCIPQIKLSTGKIVNFPIFPYHADTVETETKYGGIFKVWKSENGVFSDVDNRYLLTDAELMELYSLIHNKEVLDLTNGTYRTPTINEAYDCVLGLWFQTEDGDYRLHISILSTDYTYQHLGKCHAIPIYQASFAKDTETSPVTESSFYKAFNNYGIMPVYSDNTVVVKHPYEDMKTYVENHYTGQYRQQHAMNVNLQNNSITATYIYSMSEERLQNTFIGIYSYSYDQLYTNVSTYAVNHDLDVGVNVFDDENPYSYEPATLGGGDGSMGSFNPDGVDAAEVPSLPSITASNIGFMSVYNPTSVQLKSLSQFLWSSAFDIDSFKKLFTDPMQCIIGLGVVPVQPSIGGSKNVTFGDIDSGIVMPYISSEYIEKDCGSVSIDKLYGSFMDYNNTSIQIYLPYIGFRQLQPDDIIGGSIGVVYHINVIDGGCTAYIRHSSRGVLYQYSGSCIANIPLSSINYSGAIQNAVSAAINGSAVAAGVVTGAAPISIMGAMGLVSSAANLAMNSKAQVQRSGSVSGSAGLMGIQKPYVIIERANISVPNDMNKFVGNTTNVTMNLSQCSGYTVVDHIHLDNIPCTENERNELEDILHKGVIL